MRPIATLCILLIALPVWAGTFRDDFEDGNLDGWKMVSGLGGWRIDIEDRFSINARCNTTQNGNLATAWNQQLAIASEAGEWHRPEIRAVGSEISFYIDGKLYHKQNDTLHPSGGVALVALDAIVEFDNVIIEGPDIPDAGPSGFAVTLMGKLTRTWAAIKSF